MSQINDAVWTTCFENWVHENYEFTSENENVIITNSEKKQVPGGEVFRNFRKGVKRYLMFLQWAQGQFVPTEKDDSVMYVGLHKYERETPYTSSEVLEIYDKMNNN